VEAGASVSIEIPSTGRDCAGLNKR